MEFAIKAKFDNVTKKALTRSMREDAVKTDKLSKMTDAADFSSIEANRDDYPLSIFQDDYTLI